MIPVKPLIIAFLTFITTAFGNELTCDGDFKQKGNSCYMLIDGMAAFADADKYCKAKGGNAVSIHSKAENDFVASLGADAFIGLQYNAPKKNYSWTDGTPFDMKNWEQNYPKNPDYNGNCVLMQKSGKWINFKCEWATPFVCKKPLSSHQCPVQPDNQLFGQGQVTSPGYPGNYISGLSCTYELEVKNGWSVTINVTEMVMGDGNTIEVFSRLVADNAYRIGVLSGNLSYWPMTFTTPRGENRMLVKFTSKSQNGGYWKFDFKGGYCPDGWIDGGEIGLNYCYMVTKKYGTFIDAKNACKREGAQMISVHSAFQNKFIQEELGEYEQSVWLGFVYANGSWTWTDGSNAQYTNWKSGEPQLSKGNCARTDFDRGWETVPCDRSCLCGYPACYK